MVTFFWIVFDVAISVRMMTTGYPLWEVALWFFGGLALAIGAWIVESRDKTAADQKMTDLEHTVGGLRQELSEARHYQLGKLDVIALLGGENFRQLQNLTHTTSEPVATVISTANTQIETLISKVERYESITWLPPSPEEKDEAVTHLRILGKYSVQIGHTGQPDCYEFAAELAEIFKEAGWTVLPVSAQASQDAYGTRSMVVVGKSDDRLIRQVSNALYFNYSTKRRLG